MRKAVWTEGTAEGWPWCAPWEHGSREGVWEILGVKNELRSSGQTLQTTES